MRVPVVSVLALSLALAGCDFSPSSDPGDAQSGDISAIATAEAPPEDPLAARDPAPGTAPDPALADDQPRPLMQAQVVLERLGFAPGVVDGRMGLSTRNALRGFQEAKALPVTGELDEATRSALSHWAAMPATRLVTIPEDFAAGPFVRLPERPEDQAKLPQMGYASLEEKLAERFHTTPEVLRELNPALKTAAEQSAAQAARKPMDPALADRPPQSPYRAGMQLRVPNTGNDRVDLGSVEDRTWGDTLRMLGVANVQPRAKRIVVSKGAGTLKVFDGADKLVALFTVTTGSSRDPLPLGEWKVNGTSFNPRFSYDPSLFWDVPDSAGEHLLPPGPNGPVGVVWIDLSKEHYGIHGTPEPATIGRAESHGCVRLTNWDAARLAQMVHPGTQVQFVA